MKNINKRSKHTLIFFVYIFGQGGAERIILNVLNHINSKEYNIILLLGAKSDNHQYLNQLTNKAVHIDYLGVPFKNDGAAINALADKINQYNPDAIITEAKYTNSLSYHAKILSRNHHVKLIFREAVNRSACEDENFIQKLKVFKQYNFGPQRIICVSQGVATDLIRNYKISKKKLTTIYNPTDLSLINKKSKEPIKNDIFNKIKGKIIITAGRLAPAKNQILLLNAFNNIKTKNVSLVILGSGELEEDLKTLFNAYISLTTKKRGPRKGFCNIHIASAIGIERGIIYCKLDDTFLSVMGVNKVMPINIKLLAIDDRYNKSAFCFLLKLFEHKNMNFRKSNANTISVESLLNVTQEIPTYDKVTASGRHYKQQIIDPFERNMEVLEKLGLIKEWEYCHANGEPLTDDELRNWNYDIFSKLLIKYELNGYPPREAEQPKKPKNARGKKSPKTK